MSALLLLATLARLHGSPLPPPDTIPEATALKLYWGVLEDVRHLRAGSGAVPVYVGMPVAPLPCSMNCPSPDPAEVQRHDRLIRRLTAEPLVRGICEQRPTREAACGNSERYYVELGSVFELRPGTRLHVPETPPRDERWLDTPGAEVPVDFAVDLFVRIPCVARVDVTGCTGPETMMYRYYFRQETDGTVSLVARVLTGAV